MTGEIKRKILNYSVLVFPLALIIGIPLDILWLNRFGGAIFFILIAWFIGMLRLRDLYLAHKELTLDDIDSKEFKLVDSYWLIYIVVQFLFTLPITRDLIFERLILGINWKKSFSMGAILFVTYVPTFIFILRTFFNRTLRSEDTNRRAILIEKLKNNKTKLSRKHEEFFNDREVMMAAINQDAFNYIYASSFRFDKEMLMTAVSQALLGHHPKYIFESIEQSFLKDKDTLIEIVSRNYLFLKEIDLSSKSNLNNDLISAAVKNNPKALQFVPEIYKSDYDLIIRLFDENKFLAPLMKEYGFLNSFDSSLITKYNSRNLFSELAKKNGGILEYLPDGYRNDRLIVFEAFKSSNYSFRFANDKIKKDPEFITEINKIAKDDFFFNEIDLSLVNNQKFILNLLKENPSIHRGGFDCDNRLNEQFFKDREFCLILIELGIFSLRVHNSNFWNDKTFVLEVCQRSKDLLLYTDCVKPELLGDREVLLNLLKFDGNLLKKAPEELKNDKEVVLTAVSHSHDALNYVSQELKNDRDIAKKALLYHYWAIFYVSENLINDKSFFLELVNEDGKLLKCTSSTSKFNADKEIVLAALNQNIEAIEFVDESLLDDSDVVNVINNHIQKLNVAQ